MYSQVFYFSIGKCILSNTVSLRSNVYKVFTIFLQPETRNMEERPQLDNAIFSTQFTNWTFSLNIQNKPVSEFDVKISCTVQKSNKFQKKVNFRLQ